MDYVGKMLVKMIKNIHKKDNMMTVLLNQHNNSELNEIVNVSNANLIYQKCS